MYVDSNAQFRLLFITAATAEYFCHRFHNVGLLLITLFDTGDVLLNLAKMAVYFKDSGAGRRNRVAAVLANVLYVVFTIH